MDHSSKIDQYVLLAKSARGLAMVDLIQRATAEPGLWSFGELLELPAVQELRSGEHAGAVALLELFAYGTWRDYAAAPPPRPPALSEPQARKLRALTVASAAAGRRTLGYAELLEATGLGSRAELEALLVGDCIYGGLLRGRLDQRGGGRLLVEDAPGARDARPAEVAAAAAALREWLGRARAVLRATRAHAAAAAEGSRAAAAAAAERAAAEAAAAKAARSAADAADAAAAAAGADRAGGGGGAPAALLGVFGGGGAAGMALDEGDAFLPGGSGGSGGGGPAPPGDDEEARPSAGRHTKRRR